MNLLSDRDRADDEAARVAKLEGIISGALTAMDEGRYGDARRILKTGKADAVKPVSIVLAKGGRP